MRNEKGQFLKGNQQWLGKKRSLETIKKMSKSMTGKHWKLSEENKKNIGLAKIGNKNPMFGKHPSEKTNIKRSISLKENYRKNPVLREKIRATHGGDKHWNWRGGITENSQKIRNSLEIKLWRKAVFERDKFTCQKYGGGAGSLIAHHINNFADFPELRFAIDNGITLSEKAHREFHSKYGRKNNTRKQLEEFLQNK